MLGSSIVVWLETRSLYTAWQSRANQGSLLAKNTTDKTLSTTLLTCHIDSVGHSKAQGSKPGHNSSRGAVVNHVTLSQQHQPVKLLVQPAVVVVAV